MDNVNDPARRAAEEIAEDVFKKLGKGKNDCPPDCGKCAFQKECKEQENILIDYLAAIIARQYVGSFTEEGGRMGN